MCNTELSTRARVVLCYLWLSWPGLAVLMLGLGVGRGGIQ